MKRFMISALLVVLGSTLVTSCTTVPKEPPNSTTNTSTSRTYSK